MNEQYIERYWRDATPSDSIKEPPMVARFRDDDGEWIEKNFRLLGWSRFGTRNIGCLWYSDGVGCYRHCQVYDAPDPGERWRLVDEPQIGDEYKVNSLCKLWTPITTEWTVWSTDHVFRRRIEKPKPAPQYVPFVWEDREQLRGRWIVQVGDENAEQMINKMDFCHNEFYVNNKCARQLLDGWRFLDTGEPVGRRVEQ